MVGLKAHLVDIEQEDVGEGTVPAPEMRWNGDIPLVAELFMNRRNFLSSAGVLLAGNSLHALMPRMFAVDGSPAGKADYALRIEPCTLDIGPGVSTKTIGYNGQVPGPLLRLREGVPVSIDVTNATAQEDIVHWHGLAIDSLNDGAMEEGSPMIAAGATHRYSFTPKPSGTRWYHTHATSNDNLSLGTYTGQFGFLLIEAGPAGALRSGDQPRDPSLGAIVCADGRDDA